ncbi:hypothetical protein FRC10_003128 [Ceratobasidium sp. 414]|nr:hypothetical protein FRC10_003128 [Ceratobasidium sp. 414]
MSVNPADIGFVEIFPPINVARVGDSNEYFLGPEIPGVEPTPTGGFKDSEHKIKKQVARFRVYAYDKSSKPKLLGEINDKDYTLTWTVHVANKKASWVIFRGKFRKETWQLRNKTVQGWPEGKPPNYEYTDTRTKLIIDSGEQEIEGASAQAKALRGQFWGSRDAATPVQLGEIRTDEHGRLLVFASDGHSFSVRPPPDQDLHSGFDNDDWVDSMCDGSVRVTAKSKSSPNLTFQCKNKSTIITAPPRFASGTHCQTTLEELVEEVYERQRRAKPNYDVGDVEYYRHIYPIFKRIYLMAWTNKQAQRGHGPRKADYFDDPDFADPNADGTERRKVFNKIRVPVKEGDPENDRIRDQQATAAFMPRIAGDDGDPQDGARNRWASLTELQYDRFKKWSEGKFTTGQREVPYESFDKIPLEKQPEALTRSGLEWSIGAPLYPGIETYWVAELSTSYNPDAKYRMADSVKPGHLGRGLSLPWQSDFNMCNTHWYEPFVDMRRAD